MTVFRAGDAATTPPEAGRISALITARGSMQLRWYAPCGTDTQAPHTQDELYVVVTGSGWFRRGETRAPFAPGDAIFVPAGEAHRFEDFTDDLGVWVIFYGPEGGEHG